MIGNLIGGFVSILVGVSLIGPISTEVIGVASSTNTSGGTCQVAELASSTADAQCQLYASSSWGATVLKMVPGFFALGILGIGIAVTFTSLRSAGVV